MRLYGSLLIAICLGLGAISTVTAYLPRVRAVIEAVAAGGHITLAAPAGAHATETGEGTALIEAGEVLTLDSLQLLAEAGVERVAVREFSFGRWTYGWMFGVAALGLIVGARMLKRAAGQRTAGAASRMRRETVEPLVLLRSIRSELEKMREGFEGAADHWAGRQRMLKKLGDMQANELAAFVDGARERLVASHGMMGFATIMSRFSLLERQINRAWSAGADGVFDEVGKSLHRACDLAADVERVLA